MIPLFDFSVDKIFHVSDVHIRNFQRHKEYRQVFKRFFSDIKRRIKGNSIIYIGGDVAHAKTDMSPELVDMVSDFLKRCGNLCPTILIAGNHDLNTNNMHRLDALSPIVANVQNTTKFPIHYLKKSGIYTSENINFINYSIFDERDDWPNPPETVDKLNIGLIHGAIYNAETDLGYRITSESLTNRSFNGCHFVLAGDIHKQQVFGTNPTIIYSSSMIQQNHGETLDRHGFIEFDVNNSSFEFVELANDYGYYTLEVVNGVVPVVTDMPKKPRLRVKFINTPTDQANLASAQIRSQYNVQEFTTIRDTLSKSKSGIRPDGLDFKDVSDVNYQNTLLSDYISRQFGLDNEDVQSILRINEDLNRELSDSDVVKNIMWKPIKLDFSNMFSYGSNNSIDFSDMRGIYGLFAPNASGKSSIFSILSFCLFDKCDRAFKASHIMNTRRKSFNCKLEFEINGERYFIERNASIRKYAETVKVDVNFWKEVDGEIENLNGEARRQTNEIIRRYIGSYDEFVLTTLSLQNQNAIFIDKSQSERKDILSQFLGIGIFDKLYVIAADRIRDSSAIIRKMKKEDYDEILADYHDKLDKAEVDLNKYSSLESELDKDRSNLSDQIAAESKKLVDIKGNIHNIDDANERLIELKKNLDIKTESLTQLISNLAERKQQSSVYKKQIEKIDDSELAIAANEYREKVSESKELDVQIRTLTNDLETKAEHLSHYDRIEYDDNCEYCLKNVDLFQHKAFELKQNINSLKDRLSHLVSKSKTTVAYIKDHESVLTDLDNFSKLVNTHKSIVNEIFQMDSKKSRLEQDISETTFKIRDLETDISNYQSNEQLIESNRLIEKVIADLESNRKLLTVQHKEAKDNMIKYHGLVSTYRNKLEWAKSELEKLAQLEAETKLFEYYIDAVKRNGIPYELISEAVPTIEAEVNNILQQIVEFTMMIDIDGKNINAKIVYGDNEREWPLEMCSGMERFISSMAMRIALNNICNLPHTNFLALDEGLSVLDRDNMSQAYVLFDYVKTQYDFVILVSHLDTARDVVDSLIEIGKDSKGFSHINYC